MAFTRITGNAAQTANPGTTIAAAVTPGATGRLMLVGCGCETAGATLSIADTAGNTWNVLNAKTTQVGSGCFQSWWAVANGSGATTVTHTIAGATDVFRNILIDVYSGNDTVSPVSSQNTASGASGSPSGTVTPSDANCLIWGAANDSITAVGSGYTKGADDTAQDWSEYKEISGGSGSAQTVNFTGTSGAWMLHMGAFKPAGGAATAPPGMLTLGIAGLWPFIGLLALRTRKRWAPRVFLGVLALLLGASPALAQTTISDAQDDVAVVAAGAAGTTYTFTCVTGTGCTHRIVDTIVPKAGDTFTTSSGVILSGAILLPSTVGGGGWTAGSGSGSTVVTDNFNRANSSGLGANYTETNSGSGFDVTSNQAVSRTAGGVGNIVEYSGGGWSAANDQWSQVTLRTLVGDMGPTCRGATGAQTFYYLSIRAALGTSGNHQLQKAVAGVFSTIASWTGTFNAGDVARIECQGTSIRALNGTTVVQSVTDSSIATGVPGFYGWNSGNTVDDFGAGTFGGIWWSYPATVRHGSFNHADPPGECDTTTSNPRCKYPEDLFINNVEKLHVVQQSCTTTCTVDVAATKANLLGPGKWFYDYVGNVVYIGDDPTGQVVELSNAENALSSSANTVTIKNLTIEKFAVIAQHGAIEQTGSGWDIHHNEIRYNHGRGVTLGNAGHLHQNNIHHNFQMGIGGGGDNSLIDNNTIAYNRSNVVGISIGWEAGGTKFVGTHNLVVRLNWVHHNDGIGLWTDISNHDGEFSANKVEDNKWAGIMHEISFDWIIRDNLIRRNGLNHPNVGIGGKKCFVPDAGIFIAASSNVQIYGNFIEDNADGICAMQQDRTADETLFGEPAGSYQVRGLKVHDNTLSSIGTLGTGTQAVGISADYLPTNVVDLTGTYSGTGHPTQTLQPAGTGYNNHFQCNRYYFGNAAGGDGYWLFIDYTSFASWQALGHDTGSTATCTATNGTVGTYSAFSGYTAFTPPAIRPHFRMVH